MDFITTETGVKLAYNLTINDQKSPYLLILVHGTISHKNACYHQHFSDNSKFNTFRFDLEGNGESLGDFEIGAFERDVDNIHTVVLWAKSNGYKPLALIGHSKGGNEVLIYSAKYGDVPLIIPVAARMDMSILPNILTPIIENVYADGQATLTAAGKDFNISKSGLEERKNLNMNRCVARVRNLVCVIHGDADITTQVKDAHDISKVLGRNCFELNIIPGADHMFGEFYPTLLEIIENFITKALPLLILTHRI